MKKDQRIAVPVIGASSLLVIFAVLCLTVFALLSLNTVMAEKRMADASAQAVADYYEADLEAEKIFARLRSGETISGVEVDGNICRYCCLITDNQTLYVEVKQEADTWQICRWQVVAKSEPVSELLPVWDGT